MSTETHETPGQRVIRDCINGHYQESDARAHAVAMWQCERVDKLQDWHTWVCIRRLGGVRGAQGVTGSDEICMPTA